MATQTIPAKYLAVRSAARSAADQSSLIRPSPQLELRWLPPCSESLKTKRSRRTQFKKVFVIDASVVGA